MTETILVLGNENEDLNFARSYPLDGINFKFIFKYNAREDRWYIDLLDAEGTILRAGAKVVVNYPFLINYISDEKYKGELIVVDAKVGVIEPGFDEFGNSADFMYLDEVTWNSL